MKKQVFTLCLFIFCLFPQAAFAARSITISGDKSSLFGDEQLNISASLSGFTNGETIYIKGAFFKDGATNYFGYTKSNDSWIKNSTTAISQRQVTIGSWDAAAIVRSDFEDSGYGGKGDYKFKLGFYYLTSGGNLSSVNWSSNVLGIHLDQPNTTPTNAPTSSQTSSSTTKSTPSTKTSSSSKTPAPTKTPTAVLQTTTSVTTVLRNNNSAKIANNFDVASDFARVRNVTPTSGRKQNSIQVLGTKDQNFSPLFLLGGLIILLSGGIWFVLKNYKISEIYEKIFNKQ